MLKYSEISKEAFMFTVYCSLGLSVFFVTVIIWAKINNIHSEYIQILIAGWVIMVSLATICNILGSYFTDEFHIIKK